MKKILYYVFLVILMYGCGEVRKFNDYGACSQAEDCKKIKIDIMVLSFGQSNSNGVTANKEFFNSLTFFYFI